MLKLYLSNRLKNRPIPQYLGGTLKKQKGRQTWNASLPRLKAHEHVVPLTPFLFIANNYSLWYNIKVVLNNLI